jgi:endonuclease G
MANADLRRIQQAGERYLHHTQSQGRRSGMGASESHRAMVRLKLKGYTASEAEAVVSFAQSGSEIGRRAFERIIKTSDLTPIAFFRKGLAVSRAVCRVVIVDGAGRQAGFGTAFRISPRLVMTNNHVLEDAASARHSFVQFDYVVGLDGSDVAPVEARLDPDAFFRTDPELDFTIVALAGEAAASGSLRTRAWLPLIRESGKALKGESLNIIQHPRGDRQMIAFRDNKAVGPFGDFFHYATDTEAGSSGSPVLNDGWELAVLHHAGVPAMDPTTRVPLKIDGTPFRSGDDTALIKWVANEGVRISRIAARLDALALAAHERPLYDQCFVALDWRILESDTSAQQGPNDGIPAGPQREDDGRVTWHFALTFGPTGGPHAQRSDPEQLRPKLPTLPPATTRPPAPPKPSGIDPDARSRLEEMARRLVERGRRDRPYFDAAKDEQDKAAYYAGLNLDGSGAIPFRILSEKLSGTHRPLNNYNRARMEHLYPWVDLYEDTTLRSIYSGKKMSAQEIIADELAAIAEVDIQLAELLGEGRYQEAVVREAFVAEKLEAMEVSRRQTQTGFNCEHVVPQSWFAKKEPQRSDLHHLFTCESACNSFRGNIPYHDFADFNPQPAAEKALRLLCGKRDPAGDDRQGFEPENGKGAVARATLYFLLRYPGQIGDAQRELPRQRLGTLLEWHATFPPSRWEHHRNQAIFEAQGNRNPLIDYPNVASRIDFLPGFGS